MRHNLKTVTAIALALALLCALIPATSASATDASGVGQLWDGFTAGSGTFAVTASSRVYVAVDTAPEGDLLQTAQLIQRELQAQFSDCFAEMVWGPAEWAKTGDVVLVLDTASGTGADGYKLNVTSTTATVTAADVDGLIYGANNLMKCFRAVGGNTISCFSGNDSPDTAERTVSLDCGRKYLTAEWIKNFIRQMSWMGYNTLQLHFSEDGGFRADFWDSDCYSDAYNPNNDFSWLCGSQVQYWVSNGNKNDASYDYQTDPNAGDYLSTRELIEICEVAAEYHIDIIPSFDSPSHMDYSTWRYEKYAKSNGFSFTYGGKTYTANSSKNYCINYTDTTGGSAPSWNYAAVDITSGSVGEAFVLALYSDIADFFKAYAGSTKFSIGADEVGQGSSVKWDYADFVSYINKLNGILNDKGYTMRMYNDFLGSTTYNYSSTTSTSCKYTYDSNIEIMYWDSPFSQNTNASAGTKTVKASVLANQNRTLYNCIQSNCYYVLRVANTITGDYQYMDARNPNNLNWSFNYSTEQRIYETWTPNDFGEKGKYSTTDVVSDSRVGGAYFLIWNDYASVSTEAELWNGAPDTTGTNPGVTYYLLDRMASNIMKMWNWDIDDSVSYSDFAAVRATFGNFPGYTKCSEAASLPAATDAPEQAYLADHTALTAALEDVIDEQGKYTDESWNAYQAAVAAAEAVNADHGATAEELAAALTDLQNAAAALEVEVDRSALEAALEAVIAENNGYTEESWTAYQQAVEAAQAVLADANATQDQVDQALANLQAAQTALVPDVSDTVDGKILKVEKLTPTARLGKQVGLRVITASDVESLTITGVTTTICQGEVQTLTDLGEVKVWLVAFDAASAGTLVYSITCTDGSASVQITIK